MLYSVLPGHGCYDAAVFEAFLTALIFVALDVGLLLPAPDPVPVGGLLGLVLLSATALGAVVVVIRLALGLLGPLPRSLSARPGRLAHGAWGALLTAYPAYRFGVLMAEGDGVQRSGHATLLTVLVALATSAAVGLLCAYWWRLRRARVAVRLMAACALLGFGALCLWITGWHPRTYIGPHRGFLLLAGLSLQCGLALVRCDLRPRWLSRSGADVLGATGLVALLVVGYVLSLNGSSNRDTTAQFAFEHGLIVQKALPLLNWLQPVHFRPWDGTTLDEQALPRPALTPGKYLGADVIYLTADALRHDCLGFTEGPAGITPNLDRLRQQATYFSWAVVNYSHTTRSIRTYQTGMRHRRGARGIKLAKRFGERGYRTLAIMDRDSHFGPKKIPGFESFKRVRSGCNEMVTSFERELQSLKRSDKLFAWLHYYGTHKPHVYDDVDLKWGASKEGQYYAAVHHLDQCVGRLRDVLTRLGRWDNTIMVLASDHGEALGEHGRLLQHGTCYLHDIRIPLLIRLPGQSSARTVSTLMMVSDLLPTIANLVGLNMTGPEPDGRDLSGLLEPPSPIGKGWAFSRGHPKQYPCASLLLDRWHLIYTKAGDFHELYDVIADPDETHNLVGSEPGTIAIMRPLLDRERGRGL